MSDKIQTIHLTNVQLSIITDALEMYDMSILNRINKSVDPERRKKLKEKSLDIEELIMDLCENNE